MKETVLRVEGLGKRYRIGRLQGHDTLRDVLTAAFHAPVHRFRTAIHRAPSHGSETQARSDQEIWALSGVSFEVKKGDVLGVIGRNGAGKSTLLKILSHITEPTVGCAEIYGRVGSLLEVGTGFHPELTGRENIYLSGAILGMKKTQIDRQFDEIAAFAEVESFLDTPVKRYSSGMYLRLAFAVAAYLEPEILLVDEVLAVGDAAFQKKCLGKMEDVSRAGRTVLFVSHNMVAVRNLCTRCLWLKNGRVHALGETQTIVDQYTSDSLGLMDTSGVRDLSVADARIGIQKKGLLSKVLFQSISLLNDEGLVTSTYQEGDPIKIRLIFHSKTSVENVEIFVLILSLDGSIIFSSFSNSIDPIVEGTYTIDTTFRSNPLRPGTYGIRLYVRTGYWQDIIPEAIRFRVEAVPDDSVVSVLSHPGLWGLVRVESTWSGAERVESNEGPLGYELVERNRISF